MNQHLAVIDPHDAGIAAEAATKGDLAMLSPEQRTALYGATCRSMGLNPLSRPFEYIRLNNKLTLYATRTATDQLRKLNGVSITRVDRALEDGVLTVTVHATDASGRTDLEIGAVPIAGLKGEALANAYMKALTKAKRRVTLAICGLGWLDESEVPGVPSATTVVVNADTGEILEPDPEPAPRPIRPGRAEVAGDAGSADDDSPAGQLRQRLHRYVEHDALHRWAVANGHQSLDTVLLAELVELANKISKPAGRAVFLAEFAPPTEPAAPGAMPMFSEEDQAELERDADAVAAKWRQ